MLATSTNKKVNSKVAQLKHLLYKHMIKKKYNLDWVFNQTNHINGQVEYSNYLHLHHPEWIGCTALHFAAMDKDSDAFEALLNYNADFMITNDNNRTALHEIIEYRKSSILEKYMLDDAFVHFVLSAHLKHCNYRNPCNKDGLSHFHIACAANNIEIVEKFLQSGILIDHTVKPDCSLFPGFTPLHFATKYCAHDVTKVLLSHGANAHTKDAKGMTPLHVALEQRLKIISEAHSNETLRNRNEIILMLLLGQNFDVDMIIMNGWGLTFLHIACTFGDTYLKIAKRLLENVVNINQAVDMNSPLWSGYTPLHFAALCNLDSVKLLVSYGAGINIKDAKGVTPLDICTKRYKTKDIHAILSLSSVCKDIVIMDDQTKLTDLVLAMRNLAQFSMFFTQLEKNFRIISDSPVWPGCSPMHLAVMFLEKIPKNRQLDREVVNLHILKKLCKHSRMLHIQDIHGHTPLHLAFRLDKKSAIDLLLQHITSGSKFLDLVDEDGLSYLHIASAKNQANLLRKLLAMVTNVNEVYKGKTLTSPTVYSGSTALHLAVFNGSAKAVEILLKYGANVYAKYSNNMTPIHLVLSNIRKKLADTLLDTPNLQDSVVSGIGLSHLHIACLRGKSNVVKRLLDNGADVNGLISYSKNENERSNELSFLEQYSGYSPLLFALQYDRPTIAKLLLERGADVFVKNYAMPLIYYVLEKNFEDSLVIEEVAKKSNALKARLATDIGMTELHIACLDLDDIDTIEKLIGEGADVNAQILADSPIFQGYTPLHIVMHVSDDYDYDIVDRMIRLLIHKGADVALQAEKTGKTVVHMAWDSYCSDNIGPGDPQYFRVESLLESQRVLSLNPVSVEGISHFHIACYFCNVDIIERLLKQADVDVDQQIDYLHSRLAGYTALHLATANKSAYEMLDTVDLLLRHGADACAEDAFGNTPLHKAVLLQSSDVFERLVRSGVDVNARNSRGDSPLNSFLGLRNAPAEKIRYLLKCGCNLNAFNPITNVGNLGLTVCILSYLDLRDLISAMNVNFKQGMKMDHLGRTVIHNIVSTNSPSMYANEYIELIEKLSNGIDCGVDDRDELGRTALHMAVEFSNYKAVSGLLIGGADVNITDVKGQTAFDYLGDSCSRCNTYDEFSDGGADGRCVHLMTLEALTTHVKKLTLCGLDLNEKIEQVASKAFGKFRNMWINEFIKELEIAKNTLIGSHPLTLYEFLSENGAVADYPTMSEMKRSDINEFFSTREVKSLRAKFPEIAGILQLQYKKAEARPQLLESAKNTMELLIGFRMPEICSHFILIPLKNSELKNLILSATD